ncbi:MAG: tryptophan--tRNA ligase, partial [Deltaproteobacteria bacterium]
DNAIEIFLDEPTLKQKVMSIKTDSTPVDQPKDPDTCNLFQIYQHFAPPERVQEVLGLYREGGAAYGALKKELVGYLLDFFREAREERTKLINDPGHLRDVLARGAHKARSIAQGTIDLVRRNVGVAY